LNGNLGAVVTGYRFGEVMFDATEEGLWVDYVVLNPVTGNQEFKHSWVTKHDGLIFGSGFYQVLPNSPLDITKAAPAEYTIAVVERAARSYKAYGRARAIEHFISPESLDGDWYVFIVDESGKMTANVNQKLVGMDLADVTKTDVDSNEIGQILASVTAAGRWIHYRNPSSGEKKKKHMWIASATTDFQSGQIGLDNWRVGLWRAESLCSLCPVVAKWQPCSC
jgi:hypothetical protein